MAVTDFNHLTGHDRPMRALPQSRDCQLGAGLADPCKGLLGVPSGVSAGISERYMVSGPQLARARPNIWKDLLRRYYEAKVSEAVFHGL